MNKIFEAAITDPDTTPLLRALIEENEMLRMDLGSLGISLGSKEKDLRELLSWAHDMIQITPPADGLSCPCRTCR